MATRSKMTTRSRLLPSTQGTMAIIFACSTLIHDAGAFVSRPAILGHPVAIHRVMHEAVLVQRTSPLLSPPKQKHLTILSAISSASSRQPYPSIEEQLSFLAQAVELRRLKNVEKEQLAQSRKESLPKLALSRASGYGDDLDAYEAALKLGQEARDALVTRNMGLVHYCVKDVLKYRGSTLQSLSSDDLVQEGAIGLSRAVDRWNPEIGGKFSTYAMYWIRAAVLRGIAERDDIVRVPVHMSSAVSKMTQAARQLGLGDLDILVGGSGRGHSWDQAKAARELAEMAGLSEAQLGRAVEVQRRRRQGGILSFETWMQQGKDLSSDHASVRVSSSPLDLDHLRKELSKFLRPKEVEALSWRYGLTSDQDGFRKTVQGKWGEAMSFVEVGKRMHVSAEYGRRLCHKALEKLRVAHEQGHLEPSLLAQ